MFSNVLIGVDGRQGGRDAIALAKQLAEPNAEFTLGHVYDWPVWRESGIASAIEFDEAMLLLNGERRAGEIEAELVCECGSPPGRCLHELAVQRAADLLVVGSSRHGHLGRAVVVDDARAALNSAPCAIAIAPREYRLVHGDLRTIGVGDDRSPEGEGALAMARELSSRHGAAIRTLDGPKQELSRLSDSVDLLIVASRGDRPMQRLLHGSVTTYLLRHVTCPLLVLPRAPIELPASMPMRNLAA